MYLWVCRACGARWQRIAVGTSQQAAAQNQNSALQPTPTPSSGLRTRLKREAQAIDPQAIDQGARVEEVTIHSDGEFDEASMREV